MNEKSEVFKKLLPIKELFTVYQGLSKTILTRIDIKNLDFNSVAINNSITMLCEIGVLRFNQEKNIFQKIGPEVIEVDDFIGILYERLQVSYPDAFSFVKQADLKYDETEASLYIKRNSVSLDLSGLLMLLDGIGKIKIKKNNIFILDKNLLRCRTKDNAYSLSTMSLEELRNQLDLNEKLGVEAELAAMEYETTMLKNAGIDKIPERISEFNTNAGYDMVSFMNTDSLVPDKFIEVKNCSDNSWTFYISRNELDVAKRKQCNYYLYLYNRKNQVFRIIQNPYEFFVNTAETAQWTMEPQTYQVKCIS